MKSSRNTGKNSFTESIRPSISFSLALFIGLFLMQTYPMNRVNEICTLKGEYDLNNIETIPIRCVTALLKVDFKAPTTMGKELELKGKVRSIEGRKIWVDKMLSAGGIVCATGKILAIKLRD